MKNTLLFTIAALAVSTLAVSAMHHEGDKMMDHAKPMHECMMATGTNASGMTITGCLKPMHMMHTGDHTRKHEEMKKMMDECMSNTGSTMTGCMMKMEMMKPMHDARETMKDAKIELKAAKEEVKATKKAIKPMRKMMRKMMKKPACTGTGAMACPIK